MATAAHDEIEQALQRLLDTAPLSGLSVRLQKGDRVVLDLALGMRRRHDGLRPMSADTVFRIASITKLAVALVAIRLHETGDLSLDADLSAWLGPALHHPRYRDVPVTARHLLTHTSGLRDAQELPPTSGVALRLTLAQPDSWGPHAPGQFFSYCNLAFVVLGTAMEAATGERLDDLFQRLLFGPLGMSAQLDPAALTHQQRQNLATLYRWNGREWLPQVDEAPPGQALKPSASNSYRPGQCAAAFSPQGGLRTSLPDLARMAEMLRLHGAGLLQPASFETMAAVHWQLQAQDATRPVNGDSMGGLMRSWGLGLQHFGTQRDGAGGDHLRPDRPCPAIGHLGEAYGLLSGLLVSPRQNQDPGWTLLYAISGVPEVATTQRGHYSSFSPMEEAVLSNVLPLLDDNFA
jgi:CubicO group peptidase (beta-lactamase class C family)